MEPEPTPAQAAAGNYSKGHVQIHGMDISLENAKGGTRRGVDPDGTPWESEMHHDYGYFKRTMAADGDAVDCFIGDDPESELVVAIDQFKGRVFDETKFMLGFLTRDQAIAGYLRHYPKGWELGPVSTCTVSQLKEWLKDGDTHKPFGGQKIKTATLRPIEERLQRLAERRGTTVEAILARGTEAAEADPDMQAIKAAGLIRCHSFKEFMAAAERQWAENARRRGADPDAILQHHKHAGEKRWESWVGFDLDGTLAKKQEPFNKDTVGEPIEPMIKVLRKHLDDGDTCKIFTARAFSPGAVEVVQRWLEEQNIPKLEVTNIKDPGMTILYDDRAISVKSDVGTTKQAGQIVRKIKMVEEIHEHCPHCDHEFREKGGPRPSDYDACRESRYEDYDMVCPNCNGVIEDEEPSDEEIEKIRQSPAPFMGGAWLADYKLRKREAQRKRRAMRQDVLKSAAPKKGCLMLEMPQTFTREVQRWIKRRIPNDQLAGDGIEKESHVTILYGFPPTVSLADLEKSEHWPSGPIEIALGDIKRFKADKRRPESDVIVVEVVGDDLKKMHHAFKKEFGVTTNYPTYNAHLTLAYVKPGALEDLDGEHFLGGRWVTCDEVCYSISHDDGTRDRETVSIGSKELAKAASVERTTLGFSKSAAAAAEAPVIPRTGSAAIMHALSRMNLDDLEAQARDDIRSKKKTRRPRAVKILNIVEGLRRNELTPTDMMIRKVPVIPPNFRPFNVIGDTLLPGDANELYKDLIDSIGMYKKTRDTLGDEGAREAFKAMLQGVRAVHGYADSPNPKSVARGVSGFLEKVTGTSPKTSFIQRNLLSKPQDSVARGVIVPDPELTLDEIGVPEESAWRMYGDYVQRNLVKSGMSPMDAFKHRMDRSPMARKALERELQVRPVQYSRSPAWHEQNFVAGRPKLVSGDAITISPLVAAGMNADYDGDNMNLHVPASEEAVAEAYEKLLPSKMLWSVRDPQNRILPVPKHEMVSQLHASNVAPAKRSHRFDTEELALAAIKAGKVDLSDDVEIGPDPMAGLGARALSPLGSSPQPANMPPVTA